MTKKPKILNYKQTGAGAHIVLIHGLFGSLENLNMVAKPLAENYCVTSIDVRNHGESFQENAMSYPELAEDIANVLAHLSISQCILLGHSMGGKIAIQLALLQPELISKLIVADIAPVDYPPHHIEIIKGLKAIDLAKVKKRKDADNQLAEYVDNEGIRQFLLRNLALNDEKQFAFKCSLENISACYPDIMKAITLSPSSSPYTGPTLFIKGGNSDYIQEKHRDSISKLLPNSKARVIQNAGHWLHAEKTAAFNKIVIDFINQ